MCSSDLLLGSSEKLPDEAINTRIPPSGPEEKPDANEPTEIVVEPDPKNPDSSKPLENKPKDELKVPAYDKEMMSKIENAVQHVEIYLSALDKEYNILKENKEILDKNGIYLEDVEQTVSQATQMQKALQERIRYVKQINERKMWNLLPNAYQYLKDYRNIDPSKSRLIYNVKEAAQKVHGQAKKISDFMKTQEQKAKGGSFMGDWYQNLKKRTDDLGSLCEQNFSVSSTGASIRLQKIQGLIKRAKEYSRDIGQTAETLERTMGSKDINRWIADRRAKAMSGPQLRQAKLMEEFLSKGKKFELEIEDELKSLSEGMGKFRSEVKRGEVSEDSLKEVLRSLESIDRKYRDPYEDFNSAVTNFEFWTP